VSGEFGGARTRAGARTEHAAAEKAEGRYLSSSAKQRTHLCRWVFCYNTLMQPGDTITPAGKPGTTPEPAASHPAEPTVMAPLSPTSSPASKPNEPEQAPATTSWQSSSDSSESQGHLPASGIGQVSWTASEFVDHEKNKGWFVGLAGITVVAAAVIYLITNDTITVVVIVLAAGLFGATAKRKPRTLQYQLDSRGIHIANKSYSFDNFRSFSVLEEGAFSSIQLMPLKRFMPAISLYYPPESEDQVINTLGSYLPHEDRPRDPIDNLMRKVRF